ncbi:MAG: terminase small subunit [Oscillospiraceae bacterium]|nr:terminase small subunit [Oscillospiraceae bacterium]
MEFRGKEGENPVLERKMEKFCEEYIVDYNAYRAAIRAGYSNSTAHSHSYKLLRREDVMARICELQEEFIRKSLLDNKNRVLREYWNIYEKAMQAQPVTVWDKELKEYVPTGEYQFDDKIAMKCLEFIAKLGGMLSEKEDGKTGEDFELIVKVEKDENKA